MLKKFDLNQISLYEANYFMVQTKEDFCIDSIEYDEHMLVANVHVKTLTHDNHLTAVLSIAIATYLEVVYLGILSGEPKDRQLIQSSLSIKCNKPIYPGDDLVRFNISLENITTSLKFTAYNFLYNVHDSFEGSSQILRPLSKDFTFKANNK